MVIPVTEQSIAHLQGYPGHCGQYWRYCVNTLVLVFWVCVGHAQQLSLHCMSLGTRMNGAWCTLSNNVKKITLPKHKLDSLVWAVHISGQTEVKDVDHSKVIILNLPLLTFLMYRETRGLWRVKLSGQRRVSLTVSDLIKESIYSQFAPFQRKLYWDRIQGRTWIPVPEI